MNIKVAAFTVSQKSINKHGSPVHFFLEKHKVTVQHGHVVVPNFFYPIILQEEL